MIDQAIDEHIKNNFSFTGTLSGVSFQYGSGEGLTPPYIIMIKVADPERPSTLCFDQGDSGEALFQFSCYAGGTGNASNARYSLKILQTFHDQMNELRGDITPAIGNYRIQNNITNGVRLLGGGSNELQTWGAFFESLLLWEKV